MKKKLKYIIIVVIVIGISFLYAHIDKKNPIYDKTVDSGIYGNMGEVLEGMCVQQSFFCEENVLDGVSIKTLTFGNQLSSEYIYQIIDADSDEVLREGKIAAGDVPNGKYYTVEFEQISECKGKEFLFTLESLNAVSGNALSVYNVPKGQEDAELKLNTDDFQNNTLALRTVSKMFDVETFITVLVCLTYLIVFMSFLFKFFH